MSPSEFERARLSLFRDFGFDGRPTRLEHGPGRHTYALVRDRGTQPTVLVHGGLAESSVWAMMAGRLEGTVVVVDRPGCGLSSGFDYTGVDYRAHAADWLADVLDALGAPRANLVGNSMGGYFCMAFALAHPERVERMVLPGAPAGLDRQLPLFIRLLGNPVVGRLIGSMKLKNLSELRARVFSQLVADPEKIPDDVLQVGFDASQLPGVALTSRTMVGRVSTFAGFRRELMLRDAMTRLNVRTSFLWGERDQFAPPESGHELASRMPSASVEVLPGVGHMPQLEVPERIADLVNRALS